MAENRTLSAADACALDTLEHLEKTCPVALQSLQGPMRDVVLAAMGLCFTAGTLWGAKSLAEGIRNGATN